jgi:hypothetical protein
MKTTLVSRSSGSSTRRDQLAGDLHRREIALQAEPRSGAELAPHRAAGLRREAGGEARRIGDDDALDRPPGLEREQQLAGAVGSAGDLRRLQPRQREGGGHGRAQRARDVAHGVERLDAALVGPAQDLLDAKGRQALGAHPGTQRRRCQRRAAG